jgi:hypothetical protein
VVWDVQKNAKWNAGLVLVNRKQVSAFADLNYLPGIRIECLTWGGRWVVVAQVCETDGPVTARAKDCGNLKSLDQLISQV